MRAKRPPQRGPRIQSKDDRWGFEASRLRLKIKDSDIARLPRPPPANQTSTKAETQTTEHTPAPPPLSAWHSRHFMQPHTEYRTHRDILREVLLWYQREQITIPKLWYIHCTWKSVPRWRTSYEHTQISILGKLYLMYIRRENNRYLSGQPYYTKFDERF